MKSRRELTAFVDSIDPALVEPSPLNGRDKKPVEENSNEMCADRT
jgi:hypothetical protein